MNFEKIAGEILRWTFFSAIWLSAFVVLLSFFSILNNTTLGKSPEFIDTIIIISFILTSYAIAAKMINMTREL